MATGKRPQAAEPSSTHFRDYGGDSKGRGVKKTNATQGVCSFCGRYQFVARQSWKRKTQPICQHCGSLLVPSKKTQRKDFHLKSEAPPLPERRCRNCNARLRISNTAERCSPCQQNPNWLRRGGQR